MHIRTYAKILMTAIVAVIFLSSCSMNILQPKGSAEMIVIGMDYMNSTAAPSLTGTINDAREMGAAFKMIMDEKGVPFEIKWLVQEGYDVQMEVSVTSVSSLNTIVADLKQRIEDTVPTSIETVQTGLYDAKITAFVQNQAKADELKADFEARYPGSPGLAKVKTMSLRDKPDYPSKENIEKAIRETKLGHDDLLIIYYTGHGEKYDVLSRTSLVALLSKYSEAGMIDGAMVNAALAVEEYTEQLVCAALDAAGISNEAYSQFKNEIHNEIIKSGDRAGALITAPTARDPYYGLLDMERLYDITADLDCKVVIITDACYSGFLAGDSFPDISFETAVAHFMNSPKWPNVASMSASTNDETSKVTVVRNEEGTWQRHSMFTIEVLKRLGWVHTEQRFTYLQIPSYSIRDDGGYNTGTKVVEIPGYLARVPERQTAASFFDAIMADWMTTTQTPQNNTTVLEIYLIP